MGIIRQSPDVYYDSGVEIGTEDTWGYYRYIPLNEIIDSFTAAYVGKGKICENVVLNDITFHAIRGLQELSYDTLRCTKDLEFVVPSTLVAVMPLDYVNYIKLSWSDSNGIERVIYPTSKTSNPFNVNEPISNSGTFETNDSGVGNDNHPLGLTRTAAVDGVSQSDTWVNYKGNTTSDMGSVDSDQVDDLYGNLTGERYGIDPQYSQINGSFYVDEDLGKFHFSSNISGKTLVVRYLSDGIASTSTSGIDLTQSLVPKLAEEAIYKHILYGVLLARKDSAAGLLAQIKKERFAETRKAKLRLSNIKLEEITQILRGNSKQIKH
jgi:hypothetical protein